LYPADKHTLLRRDRGNIYLISAAVLAEAYDQVRSQPLPPAGEVFPWLHGLNPRNAGQLCFFNAQCSATRVPPINIGYRGLTVVHVPAPFGCYRPGRLLGAVNHTEILGRSQRDGHFVDPDPSKGICLRNFHIQTPKMALLSDVVVYSPRGGNNKEVLDVAEKIAQAQRLVRMKFSTSASGTPNYSTFVVTGMLHLPMLLIVDDMDVIWENHKEIVAIEPSGRITEHKIEFLVREREEMKDLTKATQISQNVYLGNTADIYNTVCEYLTPEGKVESKGFDVLIEAKDMADIASPAVLRDAEVILNGGIPPREVTLSRIGWGPAPSLTRPLSLEFPSSTPLSTARHDPSAIVSFCEWMYHIAHTPGSSMTEGSTCEDVAMTDEIIPDTSQMLDRHILIHCTDGYTESTFLALAYLIYAEGITAHEAWVKLHADLGRSFFAFEVDLKTLNCLETYLLARSPTTTALDRLSSPPVVPAWFTNLNFDGSFPSRILPHMYLGNLQHANNPEMLRALGIKRVLSIGERVDWDLQKEEDAGMQIMYLDNVQDNGIDPLLDYIDPCLQFLGIPLSIVPSNFIR
jgi:dual specificity MAP kinase phosphatase